MASLKAEKPVEKSCCSQASEPVKKEPVAKTSRTSAKAPSSKPTPKKTEQKPLSKKKGSSKKVNRECLSEIRYIAGIMCRVHKDGCYIYGVPLQQKFLN